MGHGVEQLECTLRLKPRRTSTGFVYEYSLKWNTIINVVFTLLENVVLLWANKSNLLACYGTSLLIHVQKSSSP